MATDIINTNSNIPTAAQITSAYNSGVFNTSGNANYGPVVQPPIPSTKTVTANNIGSTQPYNIPPVNYQPTTQNLALANNTAGSSILSDSGINIPTTTASDKTNLRESLSSILKGMTTQSADTEKIKAESNLQEKKQRAISISNELDALDKNFRDEVAQIKQNAAGGFGGSINSQLSQAQDRYQNTRANIALTYRIASQDYQGAEQLVQDKVESLKQNNANMINAYTLFANSINNDLTESEKLQVQANLTKKQNEAKKIENAYSNVLDKITKRGAPASVLSAVDFAAKQPNATPASIAAAAGKYLSDTSTTKAPEVQKINGVDMQWNPTTAKWETITTPIDKTGISVPLAQAQSNVEQISSLLGDSAIRSAVGPTFISRFVGRGLDTATGARQNFIAGVEQIRSNLNLESLINAKARGATFGALSDQELQVLSSSATKIGSWAKKDGSGNVTGYSASEKDFKRELDKINNFAKLDYIRRGGDPIDVNAQMQSDGSIWSKNSDGTLTRIK